MQIAKRVKPLLEAPGRVDMELFFEASQNLYDSDTNPEGNILLNVAENELMAPVMLERIQKILHNQSPPKWILKYTESGGHPDFLEQLSGFFRRHFHANAVNKENLIVSAGAAASLEITGFSLADEGDTIVIPAPAYPMYTQDLGLKAKLKRFNLQTHQSIDGLKSAALVTPGLLEETLEDLEKKGENFRILLLTTPDNPTGSTYGKDQLLAIAKWCMEHHIHLVVNEIYALSRIKNQREFHSFLTIIEELESPYLHFIYAMSKDFSMSGMRVGIIHSLNEQFMEAASAVNVPHMVSNLNQWLLHELFADETFIQNYITEHHKRLTKNYEEVQQLLQKHSIPYLPITGSLFVWTDFSQFMKEQSQEAENKLWKQIYEQTGLLLTPGEGFKHQRFGKFRIVYSSVNLEGIQEAMKRLDEFLSNRKK